jgi:DNA invertase Pin-like site-specific DNA recombinase
MSTQAATGRLIGYARVSTTGQQVGMQTDALRAAGVAPKDTYTDVGVSGKLADRPGLAKCLKRLEPGDTLVVWKLDRLGRSLPHLVETVNALAARGVGFRSLTEAIDTTTNGGKLIFHIFAALAEGHRSGRPRAMTPEQVKQARKMFADGESVAAIARVLGVSRPTVYRYLEPAATDPPTVGVQ